jgi:MFS family permease
MLVARLNRCEEQSADSALSISALENVPPQARGLLSGILQQGYAAGYLLAAVINLTVVTYSKYTWRSLYFIGAGFSLAAAILRAFLPESRQFLLAREEAKASNRRPSTSSARSAPCSRPTGSGASGPSA